MDGGHELESCGGARQVAVGHQHRVLAVGHQDPPFKLDSADLIAPHRQTEIEPKVLQVRVVAIGRAAIAIALERDRGPAATRNPLRKMGQQEEPTQRRGQGGNQEAVIAPRGGAADGSRCIAPQAVGDQPLPGQPLLAVEPRRRRISDADKSDASGEPGLRRPR